MGLFNSIFGGGESNTSNFIAPFQQPFLENIAQQGRNMYGLLSGQQTGAGFELADQLSGAGQGLLGGLMNQDLPGSAQSQFMGPGFAQEQINALGANLNRNLSLGLNNIQNRFGMAGSVGSRAGVTAGTALGDTQLALGTGIASILQGDRMARQQAAQGVDRYNLGGQSLSNQANLGGLASLQPLFNLGMSGYQNAWSPLGNYQAAVGGPIILGQGSSSNTPGVLNSTGNFLSGVGNLL